MNATQTYTAPPPLLSNYDEAVKEFERLSSERIISGLPDGQGINLAYEAVDRHLLDGNGFQTALRWIKKDRSFKDFSFRNFHDLSNQFANVLDKLTLPVGAVVSTIVGRIPEFYTTVLGSLKYRAIHCPIYPVFGPEPIVQRLLRSNAAVVVTDLDTYTLKLKQNIERLPAVRFILLTDTMVDLEKNVFSLPVRMQRASIEFDIKPTNATDPCLLHYTNGVSGMPKGVLHSHKGYASLMQTTRTVLDLQHGDKYWCTADPGNLVATTYGILAPMLAGVTTIMDEDDFDAARWYSILEEHQVNVWYTTPASIRRLMKMNVQPTGNYNLQHLRMILSGGEPLHAEAVKWGEQTFHVPMLDHWWQTETGGIMISNYRCLKVKPGSMGKPVPGVDVGLAAIRGDHFQLIDEVDTPGHLVFKKTWPGMFSNYLHETAKYESSFHGDWFISGDIAKKDSEGYYWFIGRADDLITTGGLKIGPYEIEKVFMEHPAILEAAAIGKPDPDKGEVIKIFVVTRN
ncbi:MAG: AMP-binding protein, partial [Bacteroidetes bacterium]|nr:AMP-binding protein [Bacteroidota bacterium]